MSCLARPIPSRRLVLEMKARGQGGLRKWVMAGKGDLRDKEALT